MTKINTEIYGELALVPLQVEVPVKETLAWLTDLMDAYDGSEERYQRRTMPRQSLEYKIPLQYWKKAEAQNTIYGALRKDWAIPLWTEAQNIGSSITGEIEILCDTSNYDLRDSSLALIYNACGLYEVVEISEILYNEEVEPEAIGISLAYETTLDINNAWLLPVRKGFIVGSSELSTNGRNGLSTISYQIDDNLALTSDAPTQYKGHDIYTTEMLKSSAYIARKYEQDQNISDEDLGIISRSTNWYNPKVSIPYKFIIEGAEEMRAFKEFLYRRAGKFRSFWLPTFENDMRLSSTGQINTTFNIEDDSYIDYASNRVNIAIRDSANNWHTREITSSLDLGFGKTKITIDNSLDLDASEIMAISFLGLNRLDTDRVELEWLGNGVATTKLTMMEILADDN